MRHSVGINQINVAYHTYFNYESSVFLFIATDQWRPEGGGGGGALTAGISKPTSLMSWLCPQTVVKLAFLRTLQSYDPVYYLLCQALPVYPTYNKFSCITYY